MSAARRTLAAAAGYFASVFALGFVLGAVRVLWVQPALGALAAVGVELPVMLAASLAGAAFWTRRLRVPASAAQRLALGGAAFGLLLVAEWAVSTLAFGRPAEDVLAVYRTAPGLLGLAGQALFGLCPWLITLGAKSPDAAAAERRDLRSRS